MKVVDRRFIGPRTVVKVSTDGKYVVEYISDVHNHWFRVPEFEEQSPRVCLQIDRALREFQAHEDYYGATA